MNSVDRVAEALHDSLTMLGVNPDETSEMNHMTTGQVLAGIAVSAMDIKMDNARVVKTVDELVARWHRHSGIKKEVEIGMCIGWCHAISMILDVPNAEVLAQLKAGKL